MDGAGLYLNGGNQQMEVVLETTTETGLFEVQVAPSSNPVLTEEIVRAICFTLAEQANGNGQG